MKKGISVLLVAAALFGFYGGAVNLNDILNCKDYWEEAGEKSTADMNKLEDGLNQLKDNEQAYLDGLDQVAEGEQALADGEAELAKGEADYAAAPGKLAAGEKKLAAGKAAFAQGQKDLAAGKQTLDAGKSMLKQLKDGVKELQDEKEGYPAWKNGMTATWTDLSGTTENAAQAAQYKYMFNIGQACTDKGVLQDSALKSVSDSAAAALGLPAPQGSGHLAQAMVKYISARTNKLATDRIGAKEFAEGDPVMQGETPTFPNTIKKAQDDATAELSGALQKDALTGIQLMVYATKEQVGEGYDNSVAMAALDDAMKKGVADGLRKLPAGKAKMQDKLIPLLEKVKGNEAVEKKLGNVNDIIKGLNADDKTFKATMDEIMKKAPELISEVQKAVNKGQRDYDAGKKKLAAGAKTIKAGEKELAQGYADYAAAPGKLEDGRQQLADGRAQLAAGKDKLAQYEDGEQQVRDGLATLVGTEADLELESILDRLNGDGDFDNGDNHLELDEGLAAVDVGRGYQAEDGELITKEIMTRAIGTGGLLAAGVLAVLAAILSFLKKNKGAGVLAILSAVAGAFGAYEATQAGTYFSSIAGSTVGQTGMIAAGILAAVALVHSIAHFTAKKEA